MDGGRKAFVIMQIGDPDLDNVYHQAIEPAIRVWGLEPRNGPTITDAGIQAVGSCEPLPAGSALIDYWQGRLGKAERSILEALAEAYPAALAKKEVAAKASYESKRRRLQ